jgi:GT2 family glycosyltransferase
MKLLIVIVCYKVVDLTLDCLRSLDPEIRGIVGARAVVCENGTGGDAAERFGAAIRENGWGDWCELQVIHPNRGFTGGNNHVIRPVMEAGDPPEYVLLLNTDTIVHPHALETLVRFMDEHPKVGIAGSRLDYPDGTPGPSPFRFQGIATELDRGMRLGPVSRLLSRWAVNPPTPTEAGPVDWVSGACMIIRREVIEAIGPLDEDYYTYFDDIDYCLMAKRAGWPTWFVPESRIVHLEGMTTGVQPGDRPAPKRRPPYWFQARRRFFLKSYGALYAAAADLAFILGFATWRLRRAVQRKADHDPPHMLADSIRYSVFVQGFRVEPVENPALRQSAAARVGTEVPA